jgi:hypothetical protein
VLLVAIVGSVVVVAVVAVAQGIELAIPTAAECRGFKAPVARCLNTVSAEGSTALTFAWVGVAALLIGGTCLILGAKRFANLPTAASVSRMRRRSVTDPHNATSTRERLPESERLYREPSQAIPHTGEAGDQLYRDRLLLIQTCIAVSELVDSPAIREQLDDALEAVGISRLQAARGDPFDPARYKAVGTVPTNDTALQDVIAGLQRVGYADRGKRLNYPEVLVYQVEDGGQR